MQNSLRNLCILINEDYRSNGSDWTKPGFRSLAVYRFGVWRMTVNSKILRAPMSLLYRFLYRRCRNRYGIELPYSVIIGRRLIIEHQGSIVVHGKTIIGDDCIIRQNCTFGIRYLQEPDSAPTLGDRVNVGAGAVLLGAIRIGDDTTIGANAVVLTDVPNYCTAVGNPGRVIRRQTPSQVGNQL